MKVARAVSRQTVIVLITMIKTPSDIYNNIVIFGDGVPKGINIWNLNTWLSTANWKCRFSGGAASKHFHHYIQPTLNQTNVKTDIAVLHMGTNGILNAEANEDLDLIKIWYRSC